MRGLWKAGTRVRVRRMCSRHRVVLIVAILAGLMCLGACSLPEGDQSSPTQLHYKWVKVRAAGDADQMWDLLHPSVRAEFQQWLMAEQLMVNEIKDGLPERGRDQGARRHRRSGPG